MALYDKASLVLIPSGTKAGKVFSQKPVPAPTGVELVTNGTFDTDSDWDIFGESEIENGSARIYSSGGALSYIGQSSILENNEKYRLTYEVKQNIQGSLKLTSVNGQADFPIISTRGSHSLDFIANNPNFFILRNSGATDITIDNVSVRQVVDGDFDFTRSSYATRVNSQGLIEKERSNLIRQSNSFDTTWTTDNVANPTSGVSGYDGTSDGWLLNINGGTVSQHIKQSVSGSGVQTFSVYAKANALDWMLLYVATSTLTRAYFDIANGSLGSTNNLIESKITSAGSGWYRCSITFNASITDVRIYLANANGSLTQSSGSIYIQDAQLEQGLVATDYIETTTAAVYEGITDNVPRLDYDGDCPSLLLEPQRTNKIDNSEFISDDSSWTEENGADCTPNYATSPEGVDNATRVQLDNSGANSLTRIFHDFTPDSSNDTASFYAKSNTGSSLDVAFYFRDSGFGTVRAFQVFTLTTEWQRFELTADCSGASGNVMFLIYNTTASENWDFLLYAPQVEAGSYATSYIPTYGTSVTRNEDSPSGLDVTPFTGSAYTIFLDYKDAQRGSPNTGNWMYLYNTSNQLLTYVYGGTLMIHSTSGEDYTSFTFGDAKIAFAYDGTNVKYFLNGTLVKTVTASTRWDLEAEQYWIYNTPFGNSTSTISYNSFVIFPEALTDQQCIDLTT